MNKGINLLFLFFIILSTRGVSQDLTPQKREAGHYANFFHFKFLPGKSDEGNTLLQNVLVPAFNDAGIHVTVIEDLVGTKDTYILIDLEEGPAYYENLVSRQDVKVWNALVKVHGSPEEADKQVDKFIDLLEEQSQTLVFMPNVK